MPPGDLISKILMQRIINKKVIDYLKSILITWKYSMISNTYVITQPETSKKSHRISQIIVDLTLSRLQ